MTVAELMSVLSRVKRPEEHEVIIYETRYRAGLTLGVAVRRAVIGIDRDTNKIILIPDEQMIKVSNSKGVKS